MNNLCDRVLALLNQSEEDPAFQSFIADLGDSPQLTQIEEGSEISHHMFTELGLSLFSIDKIVLIASFHVIPDNNENGKTHPYTQDLPFGVSVNDDRTVVRAKLGQPLQSNHIGDADISESYELDGWQPVFWYSLPKEAISEVRVMPRKLPIHELEVDDLEIAEPGSNGSGVDNAELPR